jgi:hypothetical protein
MTYAYSYNTNSINKYESIQSDISDAYAYLDEVDEEQAKVFALSWDN